MRQFVRVFSLKSFPFYGMTSSRCRNLHDVFLILAVNCGNLTDPANGQIDHTATFRQTATYSCNTGYNLVGDSNHERSEISSVTNF